jgi:outer membrane protein
MKRILLLFTLFIIVIQVQAQSEMNMAIVDFDAALERHPKYEANTDLVDTQRKKLEQGIDLLSTEFNSKLQTFQAGYFELGEAEKKAAEQELALLEKQLTEARQNYVDELEAAQKKYIEPLEADVQKAINKVASQRGFNFVTSASLFYVADSSRDITTLVIELLKQQ